jgi:serine protease Do
MFCFPAKTTASPPTFGISVVAPCLLASALWGAVPAVAAPAGIDRLDGSHSATVDARRRTPVVQAVEKVAPSVVSITTEVAQTDLFFQTRTGSSEGSGVVLSAEGVILTNDHVIRGAHRITATFSDGRSYDASLIGTAPELDLAVLQIAPSADDPPLSGVEVGASGDLLLGEPVIAIGNPFGLGHTVTTGVVSAVSRPLETDDRVYQDFIQTDASINPGNSGGPLLDVTGRLIGINTAIYPQGRGIGFAIPVDRAVKVARDLVQFGTVQVPWLGVDLEDIAIRTRVGRRIAIRVVRVYPDSPAARIGLTADDLLTGVDGRELHGRSDLNAHLAAYDPGRSFTLEAVRSGSPLELRLATTPLPEASVDRAIRVVMGIEVTDASDRRGVVLEQLDPQGSLAQMGLRPGDRVLAINGHATPTVDAFRTSVGRIKSGHRPTALFTIQRRMHVARVSAAL